MKSHRIIDCEDRPKTYRADIDVPPTEYCYGRRCHVNLDETNTAKIQEVADKCGMTLDAFIRLYVGEGLPNQKKHRGRKLNIGDKSIRFECVDAKLQARIKRAAKVQGQSLPAFGAAAVESSMEADEDDMVFHPKTGQVVADGLEIRNLRHNEEFTAPSLKNQRGEESRCFKLSPGYEELCAAKEQPGATTKRVIPPPEKFTATLSPEGVKAVQAYEKATGFTPEDIISGILVAALGDPRDWRLHSEDVLQAAVARKGDE